ncbi:MAG: LTA synthase family protein [Lewinellaceae bacterium]|nr:LTA synthase family protein [Lewinellaceae bacterium]
MKTVVAFPLRLGLFWLLFFALFRLWFVLWFRHDWSPQEPLSAWSAFWHALPLDMSMAGYLLLLPVLFWFIGLLIGPGAYPVFNSLISGFNFLIITAFVFIFGANVFIYEEWHTPLNHRAVEYLSTPRALLDSMSFGFKLVAVGLFVGGVWLVWQVYKRIVGHELYPETISRWGFLALPVWIGLLALAIRGGLGVMPINESAVYYSVHAFNNHAATNTAWYLAHSQLETRSTENHYRFMPDEEAAEQVDFLMRNGHPDVEYHMNLLGTQPDSTRLNVVFLIMESMTAQVVEELGGEKGVCPNLSRLIREGILFENIYGSGYRTDQGVVSILGGYPAQPDQSIVLLSDKAEKIRSLPMMLYEQGYSTAFFYGGELTFANIGVWLRNQKMEVIRSEPDFPSADKTQRWGVDDYKLLQHSIQEINQLRPPFLAAAMTLSLHPPFDVPYQSKWQNGGTEAHLFLHSAAFADYAIGEFFKTAEQQTWYDNTLFVLVADHGASHPGAAGHG